MQNLKINIGYWFYLIKMNLKSSFNNKKKAFFEIIFMLISRLFLIAIWLVFFNFYKDVNGWNLSDLSVMLAVIAGAYGILQIFFGGFYKIYDMIINGQLDCYLIQPNNVLWSIILSKSYLRGWGDILYLIILIPLAKLFYFKSILLLFISVICSSLICLSINVLVMALGFWIKSLGNFVQKYYLTLLIFCSYPTNIYSGVIKVLLYTIIPAGIMGYMPVSLINNFSWTSLLILVFVTSFFVFISNKMFNLGLLRYVSKSSFYRR